MTTQNPAQDVSDAALIEFSRIKLWFFRDLVDAQRKALFLLCGFSDAVTHGELDTHSAQLRALRHALRIDAARELQQAQVVGEGVTVTVSGLTGSGKSAIAMEIEILCRALGLEVSWDDDGERNMTGGDSAAALALYKPRVTIIEQNIPRAS